ncbi:hypothetical protein G9U51_15225 [Calidifontibacter sp. DB0510]|uniref:Uncharacterized protein n=1 Tax=Metallococcus carri TaxID=1656884 RepID=A0A967EG11_9MICO|nr:hypothetical protein [Metallococcus carri]NHN57121.1 hypothetical protein [Metallococcus carri]NOP39010.1 hypothetical protein [Calidifontibacter sp. DB2511S]
MDGNALTAVGLLMVGVVCELGYGLTHLSSPWGWAYVLLAIVSMVAVHLVWRSREQSDHRQQR